VRANLKVYAVHPNILHKDLDASNANAA